MMTRRKKILLWSLTGIVAPLLYLFWGVLRGPDPITVSAETTFITSPVHGSGYVDFAEEINRAMQTGTSDAETLNVMSVLNAVNSLTASVLPLKKNADDLAVIEWTPEIRAQLDRFIDLLRANRGVLQIPSIADDGLFQIAFFESRVCRDFGNTLLPINNTVQLLLRTSIHEFLAAGDVERAVRDAESLAEVQRFLMRQKSLLPTLIAFSCQKQLINDLAIHLNAGRLSSDQCRNFLNTMPRLQRQDLEASTKLIRMNSLNWVFAVHSGRQSVTASIGTPSMLVRAFGGLQDRWVLGNTDWNLLCKRTNRFFDDAEVSLGKLYADDSDVKSEKLPTMTNSDEPAVWAWTRTGMTDVVGQWMTQLSQREWTTLVSETQRNERRRHLFQIAIELHEYRTQFGRFPPTRDELAGGASISAEPGTMIVADAVTYSPTPSGFAISMADADDRVQLTFDAATGYQLD